MFGWRGTEGTLEGRLAGGSVVGSEKASSTALARSGRSESRIGRAFHRVEAEVVLAGVAVDAVEKRGEVDQLVARFDELEVE